MQAKLRRFNEILAVSGWQAATTYAQATQDGACLQAVRLHEEREARRLGGAPAKKAAEPMRPGKTERDGGRAAAEQRRAKRRIEDQERTRKTKGPSGGGGAQHGSSKKSEPKGKGKKAA